MSSPVTVETRSTTLLVYHYLNENFLTHIITVSAVCKFNPRPPARVERMKILNSESGALNICTNWARSSVLVPPSRRRCFHPIIFKKSSIMSMTLVIWKKMRTLWPVEKNLGRIRLSSSILPDVRTSFSSTSPLGLILSSTLSNKKGCWQILRSCISSLLRPLTPAGFLTTRSKYEW